VVGPASPDSDSGTESTEFALLSLRAHRQGDEWDAVFRAIDADPLPVEQAVRTLTTRQLAPVMRLRVIHDLGRLGMLADMETEARILAADLAGVMPGDAESDSFENLVNLASQPDLSFRGFVESLEDQGMVHETMLMMAPDECSDATTGTGPNPPTRIVASFEAPGRPLDFAFGADPLNWPTCNPFFLDMTASQKTSLPTDNVDGTAYQARVREKVGIPVLWELLTNLDVRYFVTNEAVGMEFTFAGSLDGQIDVDHGFVIVENHPTKAGWVMVRSQKTVRFTRLSNVPASFACELGWVHVMQNMASCSPSN
jgi:hypothetical protein